MLCIVQFGCTQQTTYLAVEADSCEEAREFAEESAIEAWESYESNVEQNEFERYSDAWWDTLHSEIHYAVEPFDDSDDFHFDILKEQDFGFFKI
jgi:hypothetical protein